jgi:solute carrier family 25 phosphate transporter 3
MTSKHVELRSVSRKNDDNHRIENDVARRTSTIADSYGPRHYWKSGLAGGLCCTVTHSALCPIDVVKTRIQLTPDKLKPLGLIGALRHIVAEEGVEALATGLGPTAVAYFVQGFWKFGGVELFKVQLTRGLGDDAAWRHRTLVYLAASALAEFIADIFLCPFEATRIRLVANPNYAKGLVDAFPRIWAEDGVIRGFYSGFGPILFKQVPYTMAKFTVQGTSEETLRAAFPNHEGSSYRRDIFFTLASGTLAGIAAAVVSHPADTLLSMVNRSPTAGGAGSVPTRVLRLAKQTGARRLLLTGLGARCVMVGTLTAAQFGFFDLAMSVTGASKFVFRDPAVINPRPPSK